MPRSARPFVSPLLDGFEEVQLVGSLDSRVLAHAEGEDRLLKGRMQAHGLADPAKLASTAGRGTLRVLLSQLLKRSPSCEEKSRFRSTLGILRRLTCCDVDLDIVLAFKLGLDAVQQVSSRLGEQDVLQPQLFLCGERRADADSLQFTRGNICASKGRRQQAVQASTIPGQHHERWHSPDSCFEPHAANTVQLRAS